MEVDAQISYCLVYGQCAELCGQCSELCGVNHGFMPIKIIAVDELLPV